MIELRRPRAEDKGAWLPMYLRYAKLVESEETGQREADIFWDWLMQGTHRIGAFFAVVDGKLAGFAHYRPFPRTLNGNEACYLDDLYVSDEFRGRKIAELLIQTLKDESTKQGWTEVRWVTTSRNERARKVYERVGNLSDLLTYRTDV